MKKTECWICYHKNYYKEVREKNRVHYEYYRLDGTQEVPPDYTEISFVCLRSDGRMELPSTVEIACRSASRRVPELEGFHFHTLRHPYVKHATKKYSAKAEIPNHQVKFDSLGFLFFILSRAV